jgi:hypothetical protein
VAAATTTEHKDCRLSQLDRTGPTHPWLRGAVTPLRNKADEARTGALPTTIGSRALAFSLKLRPGFRELGVPDECS